MHEQNRHPTHTLKRKLNDLPEPFEEAREDVFDREVAKHVNAYREDLDIIQCADMREPDAYLDAENNIRRLLSFQDSFSRQVIKRLEGALAEKQDTEQLDVLQTMQEMQKKERVRSSAGKRGSR
jgi:hypothetical protein